MGFSLISTGAGRIDEHELFEANISTVIRNIGSWLSDRVQFRADYEKLMELLKDFDSPIL
jgi:hypothetical protein